MPPISIEPFRPADQETVKQLLLDAGLPVNDLTSESLQEFLVAHQGATVVGAAGIEMYDGIALLRSVVVQENLRGTGLGKRLVQAMEMRAGRLGVKHLYLLTTTASDFFIECGYRRLARSAVPAAIRATSQFSKLCPDTSVILLKALKRESHGENL